MYRQLFIYRFRAPYKENYLIDQRFDKNVHFLVDKLLISIWFDKSAGAWAAIFVSSHLFLKVPGMETHSDLGQIIQSNFLNKELFNYCWIIWYPIETKIFFFHFDHDSNTDLVILLKLGCSLLINFDPIIQFWTLITFPIPKHQRERKNPDFYIQI